MLAAFKEDRWEILRSLPIFVALFVEEFVPDEVAKWTGWNDTQNNLRVQNWLRHDSCSWRRMQSTLYANGRCQLCEQVHAFRSNRCRHR